MPPVRSVQLSNSIRAGDESLEVALVQADDIPWGEIAFRSVTHCLEHYLKDAAQGSFGFHETALGPLSKAI